MLDYRSTGIQKYILDRLTLINDEVVNKDSEYRELLQKVNQRRKQIAAKLSIEDQDLLEAYEGSWLAQICRQEEIVYNEGLMDGIMFGYWVALVGRGVEKIKV